MCEFCHLHCHTHYSLNDALPSPTQLAHKMRHMGFAAGAITDHGRMGGCAEFYEACKDDDIDAPKIKPILGVEGYVCPDRFVKEQVIRDDGKKGRPKSHHLTLLAQNATGYRNLLRLQSIASEDGFYYEPRMDWQAIQEHSEGVIALSGCLGSEFNTKLRKEDLEGAKEVMMRFKDVFGDRYYCELHNHGIDEQKKILRHQVNLARECDVPVLAANDVHYIEPEDWEMHDTFIQFRDQSKMGDDSSNGKRKAYSSKQFWLKSEEEMALKFKPAPEALSNTLLLAERVEDFMKLDTPHLLPAAEVPQNDTKFLAFYKRHLPYNHPNEAYLAYLAFKGLKMMGKEKDQTYVTRCKAELEQIWYSGVTDYFLIQYEAVQFMKGNNILYGIRGSGVGSLVNYCLNISAMDPVRWNLQFARFLNPGRGTQFDLEFKCYPLKQYLSEHALPDQNSYNARLRKAVAECQSANSDLDPFGPEISKELWAIENQSIASYFCFLADEHLTSTTNDAQSWVAYFLGITPNRPEVAMKIKKVSTLPDVDTDVDNRHRDGLIDWARQRFGEEKVKVIGAYGTFQARAAVKGALKTSTRFRDQYGDKTHAMSEVVSKAIPSKIEDLAEAESEPDVLKMAAMESSDFNVYYKKWAKEMQLASHIMGKIGNLQVHASGVLISSEDVRDHSPLDNSKGTICSAYDMGMVDRVGLVKYDYLGLKMYQKLSRAIAMIMRNHNVEINLAEIPLDDPKVYKLFTLGHTNSTFQFSGQGMKDSLKQVGADNLEDLIAVVALFRPGPLKFIPQYAANKKNPDLVKYPHPIVEKHLKVTHGIVVYQEQAMFMAQELGGFNWDEVEKVRKTVSKKDPEGFAKICEVLLKKATARGIPAKAVHETIALMKNFAGYAFNRCLSKDTVIYDTSGSKHTIEGLYRNWKGLQVHALTKDWKFVPREITNVFFNGKKTVFEVTTSLGNVIRATDNHKFLTLAGWRELKDISTGTCIASPRLQKFNLNETWDDYKIITLAGLISEGNTCHPSTVYVYNKQKSFIDDFDQAVIQFPKTKTRITQRDGGILVLSANTGLAGRDVSGVYEWSRELGITYKKATQKFIPRKVFNLSDRCIALLLGRLWSGDGFIANDREFMPYYATSSHQLAEDVRDLLLRLGIIAKISTKSFKYRDMRKVGWTVKVLGENSQDQFLDIIAPHIISRDSAVDQLRIYRENTRKQKESSDLIPCDVFHVIEQCLRAKGITKASLVAMTGIAPRTLHQDKAKKGYRRSTILKIGQALESPELIDIASSDITWDRVDSIELKGEEDTYDLSIDSDHNYIANNLVVHNCHAGSYALLAYWTGYFRQYYPSEWLAACIHVDKDSQDRKNKIASYRRDAELVGVKVIAADVNYSRLDTDVLSNGHIILPLSSIDGIGESIDSITELQPFDDLSDLVIRAQPNRGTLQALAEGGALRSLPDCTSRSLEDIMALADEYIVKRKAIEKSASRRSKLKAKIDSPLFDLKLSKQPIPVINKTFNSKGQL